MSRIGNLPIQIPAGVTVEKTGDILVVVGVKGTLNLLFPKNLQIDITPEQVVIKRKGESKKDKSLHGLFRSLINNMVTGVVSGWSKNLELQGVGFRAQSSGNTLTLSLGFSHPVEVSAPEGITLEVTDNTKITVSGIDKYLVGQVAANIRAIKPPDVYKGKGVRFEGEYVRKKMGKAGKVGAGVAK